MSNDNQLYEYYQLGNSFEYAHFVLDKACQYYQLLKQLGMEDVFKKTFGRTRFFEPKAVSQFRAALKGYQNELSKERKVLTKQQTPENRGELFLKPQLAALTLALRLLQPAYETIDGWKKKDKTRTRYKNVLMERINT